MMNAPDRDKMLAFVLNRKVYRDSNTPEIFAAAMFERENKSRYAFFIYRDFELMTLELPDVEYEISDPTAEIEG